MIISKRKQTNNRIVKVPTVRVHKCGNIVLNKATLELLEIDDLKHDGVIFGYEGERIFIAYSNEVEAYRSALILIGQSFRFGAKYESDNILSIHQLESNQNHLFFKLDVNNPKIVDGYKLYELKKID